MSTIPQTYTADHTLVFDAALRDARAQLPRTADATRADRGVVLALNGHVTLYSPTMAYVTSERDPEVWYQTTRWDCDCPDSVRRRAAADPQAAPGLVFCKHQYAVALLAMAHVALHAKGYVPEVAEVWYPAVSLDEEWYGHSGYAMETGDGGWWFCYADWNGGFYTDALSLELYERTPLHVTAWQGTVQRWSRWLQGA